MPEKQPKRPNNNAKALENWESEGGAPASDDRSTKRKRPRDLNQITKAQPLTDHKQKRKKNLGPTSLSFARGFQCPLSPT